MGISYRRMLDQEARALLVRLIRIRPFVMSEPMLLAASLLPKAQIAIERYLAENRHILKNQVESFRQWLKQSEGRTTPDEAQRRFIFLRFRFNAVLTQLDLFSQVITQRSENDNGVCLSGLDVVAADALALPGYYEAPPVICYLDRGVGAAIRRARTRLPGGGENPVAIIRIPRERMVGSGIASSLIHEVGHQGSFLLGLVPSVLDMLRQKGRTIGPQEVTSLYERWISEILADFWSVARVGIVSTLGLLAVVSLPRPFVFRVNVDDPHPMPWFRMKISCAMGNALFPDPQWKNLSDLWDSYYPLDNLDTDRRSLITGLEKSLPAFVRELVNHRPSSLAGKTLKEAMNTQARTPEKLTALFRKWEKDPKEMYRSPPSLTFAVLGQARSRDLIGPEDESELLTKLLNHWAMRSTLDMSALCATVPGQASAQQHGYA